jgi:hypothetical protein
VKALNDTVFFTHTMVILDFFYQWKLASSSILKQFIDVRTAIYRRDGRRQIEYLLFENRSNIISKMTGLEEDLKKNKRWQIFMVIVKST